MSCTVRRITFTVLMYLGIAIFLFQYLAGKSSTAALFLIGGPVLTVVAGMLRCFLTEGDCSERTFPRTTP